MTTKSSKSRRSLPAVVVNSSVGAGFHGQTFSKCPDEPQLQITYSYITPGRQSIEGFKLLRKVPAIGKGTELANAVVAINVAMDNLVRTLRANRQGYFDLEWDEKTAKREVSAVKELLAPGTKVNSFLCNEGKDGTILPPKDLLEEVTARMKESDAFASNRPWGKG